MKTTLKSRKGWKKVAYRYGIINNLVVFIAKIKNIPLDELYQERY